LADLAVSASQDEAAWILFGPVSAPGSIDDVLARGAAVRMIHTKSYLVLGRGADLNGDGRSDFAVAAPDDRQGDGAAYLVFGRPERTDIVLADLAVDRGVVFHGSGSENLGEAIDFGTDFDCDGIPDLVVGSPDWNPDGQNQGNRQGRAYVLSGRDAPGSVETAALGEGVRRIESPDLTRRRFGEAVAFVGDLNGDGTGDLAIGALNANGGAAHVIYGGAAAEPMPP
jgi:hypothetical protein